MSLIGTEPTHVCFGFHRFRVLFSIFTHFHRHSILMAYLVQHVPTAFRGKFLPRGKTRYRLRREAMLRVLEDSKKSGIVFTADHARPEWVSEANKQRGANVPKYNFLGFKVRSSDKIAEPGFPTHWH
ncbi:N-acetyltransferase complex ARD1 subunit [Perkinsela sp. CCAP 1560/4]|nr:N-acetyltransferase complex ARD1 subunit [Perkinsela sp. CCAP 1560/4]|eukprot:KNH06277.1 N-acetyltransferase complex ARD1 subunit [Perkinsela sp. CCAP 1560/4]